MEDKITIAGQGDIPEILDLQHRAFKVLADRWNRYDIEPLRETSDNIERELAEGVILKYVFRGRIAGSVRGRITGDGHCYIGKLSVDPEVQNKGIGRKLMLAIESNFPDCTVFELFTSAATPNSRHLYESLGYRPVEKENDDPFVVFYEKSNKPK